MASERAERIAREARDQAICSIASSCRPDERAGADARAARDRRADSGLAAAFAAWRRTGSVRRGSGGTVRPAAVARRRLYPRAARGRLRRARPPSRPEDRRLLPAFAPRSRRIKTHVGGRGDGLKLSLVQKVIDECERRDDPALTKVRVLLWRFAAEAARAEARRFRARGGCFRIRGVGCRGSWTFLPSMTTPARRRSWIADFGEAPNSRAGAGANAAAERSERGSGAARRTAARACRPARRGGVSSGARDRRLVGGFRHRLPRFSHSLPQN